MNHPAYLQDYARQYQSEKIQAAQRERATRQNRSRRFSLKWPGFLRIRPLRRHILRRVGLSAS